MTDAHHQLIEGACETIETWSSRLQVSSVEIEALIADGIFRRLPGNKTLLRLDFVGLISLPNRGLFVLPKVCGPAAGLDDIRRTIGTIQTYEKRSRQLNVAMAGEVTLYSKGGKALDLFLRLANWGLNRGLHKSEEAAKSYEFAHIDWRATIDRTFPAHMGSNVIYVEPIGKQSRQALTELATIQAFAMLDLGKRLQPLVPIWFDTHDPFFEECENLVQEELPASVDLPAIFVCLENAQSRMMRDADQELISLLTEWASADFNDSQEPQFYGTNAYHTIWEDSCVWYLGGPDQQIAHETIASQPSYVPSQKYVGNSSQIPDFLRATENFVWLADAKWYRAAAGELPSLPDLIKQFVYELSVLPNYEIRSNCFLVPHVGGEAVQSLGHAEMSKNAVRDERFPSVKVISLDWRVVADGYRSNKKCLDWKAVLES